MQSKGETLDVIEFPDPWHKGFFSAGKPRNPRKTLYVIEFLTPSIKGFLCKGSVESKAKNPLCNRLSGPLLYRICIAVSLTDFHEIQEKPFRFMWFFFSRKKINKTKMMKISVEASAPRRVSLEFPILRWTE